MHARPSINHIYVICTKDPCIQETMQIWRTSHIISKKHDVAAGCPCIDDVNSTLNVMSGEVESNKLVVVYAVIFQEHEIACISIGRACSDARRF